MIKRILFTSLAWCLFLTITGFILLVLGINEPTGYIKWVNPIAIFVITYWFFLGATFIHNFLLKKLKWNKWITASIGVIVIYLLIITPLILDNEYFQELDWRVPAFLITQIVLLVFFDYLVVKMLIKKTK
ncbi:hypothetical protein OO013_17575 [Mangrovivirga sp. M17]|uniref:Integral membrane protein n=1 Tax=Mangrovivirga halotolerans TaxID=2993936 RepID=A0ABT3RVA3_9BACT|nr:hypothetical protein [Mangrovivirga halotolerans]MCX2745697.1 hypothetical protein [Mangrovivirga halotolerans]